MSAPTTTTSPRPLTLISATPHEFARPPVYDSAHILEFIVRKYDGEEWGPRLVTGDVDVDLTIRQIVVLCEGCVDAVVLVRFENQRERGRQSDLWLQRQNRKIDGAMRVLGEMVAQMRREGREYLAGREVSVADIAVVCTIGFIDFAGMRPGWEDGEGAMLRAWWEGLDGRVGWRESRPVMFDLKEDVV